MPNGPLANLTSCIWASFVISVLAAGEFFWKSFFTHDNPDQAGLVFALLAVIQFVAIRYLKYIKE